MKTINHECYVSLEVAKLLKEAGFDWSVMHFYDEFENGKIPFYSRGAEELQQNMNAFGYYSAPTLDTAQRWLREVKNIYIEVQVFSDSNINDVRYGVNIENSSIATPELYHTYEEAQEAGIKKALKIILEKKRKNENYGGEL